MGAIEFNFFTFMILTILVATITLCVILSRVSKKQRKENERNL